MAYFWAVARYDLRLSDEEFYRLTPRQFRLLRERHREELAHRELVQAWTTAAVINHSMCRPEEPVSPLDYMPHHKLAKPVHEPTEEELEAEHEYNLRVLQRAAELRAAAAKRDKDGSSHPGDHRPPGPGEGRGSAAGEA